MSYRIYKKPVDVYKQLFHSENLQLFLKFGEEFLATGTYIYAISEGPQIKADPEKHRFDLDTLKRLYDYAGRAELIEVKDGVESIIVCWNYELEGNPWSATERRPMWVIWESDRFRNPKQRADLNLHSYFKKMWTGVPL